MFTGLVQAVGRVAALTPTEAGVQLAIDPGPWRHQPAPGDSVSIAGVCLTVGDPGPPFTFDVVAETLGLTTLGELDAGSPVNLEPSLAAGDPLGGHFVQGHVDGVGVVQAVRADASDWRLTIEPPAHLMDYIAPKGSITLDGVSLTIAEVAAATFTVALIPTTLERTTLRDLRAGGRVNIETDILARAAVHYLSRR